RTTPRPFPSGRPARRLRDRPLRGVLPESARRGLKRRSICSLRLHLIQLTVHAVILPLRLASLMPSSAKSRNKNVCKCDGRAKTRYARARAQQIFRSTIRPATAGKMASGVLLGAEVALVIQPFLARAALVVIPVRRGAGRGAVLV